VEIRQGLLLFRRAKRKFEELPDVARIRRGRLHGDDEIEQNWDLIAKGRRQVGIVEDFLNGHLGAAVSKGGRHLVRHRRAEHHRQSLPAARHRPLANTTSGEEDLLCSLKAHTQTLHIDLTRRKMWG
jgi:hypothetical protein